MTPDPLLTALTGTLGALVGVLVNNLVSLWRDTLTAKRAGRERRYGDRLQAVGRLLAQGDDIQRLASDRLARSEYGGQMMPAEENEGDERNKRWPALQDALALVHLLTSSSCRIAATTFVMSVEEYAWTGGGLEQLEDARRTFIRAAQWELDVEPNPVKRPKHLV